MENTGLDPALARRHDAVVIRAGGGGWSLELSRRGSHAPRANAGSNLARDKGVRQCVEAWRRGRAIALYTFKASYSAVDRLSPSAPKTSSSRNLPSPSPCLHTPFRALGGSWSTALYDALKVYGAIALPLLLRASAHRRTPLSRARLLPALALGA